MRAGLDSNSIDSTTVLASMIHGLLSGARGTYAAEPLREDEPLKGLVGLEAGMPEEATVWRARCAMPGASKPFCIQRATDCDRASHGSWPAWPPVEKLGACRGNPSPSWFIPTHDPSHLNQREGSGFWGEQTQSCIPMWY